MFKEASYINKEETLVLAVKNNGEVLRVNLESGSWLTDNLFEWVDEGNEIKEYDTSKELEEWRNTAKASSLQCKAVLYNKGILKQAEDFVASQGGLLGLAWDSASYWERKQGLVLTVADHLGLTKEELDDLFKAAQEGVV